MVGRCEQYYSQKEQDYKSQDAAAVGNGGDVLQGGTTKDGQESVDKSPMAWDFSSAPWNKSKRPRIEEVGTDGTTQVLPENPPDLKEDDKSGPSSVKVKIFGS